MEENQKIQLKPIKAFIPDQIFTYMILVLFGIFFIMFLVFPLINILQASFLSDGQLTFENYLAYFGKARIRRSLYHSLYIGTMTTVITTVAAFLVAYAITRTSVRGKTFYKAVSSLPLMAPSVVQALALISLFGRNGLITNMVGGQWNIYGPVGIIIAESFYCFHGIYMVP